MKQLFMGLICLSLCSAASAQQPQAAQATATATASKPVLKFKEDTHDFGTVNEGPAAEADFEFTNTGKSPLVIQEAKGSCGCTVPTWPKEPIMPGRKGKIHVSYNTQGKPGPIAKEVYVTANTQEGRSVLHIRGTVEAARDAGTH